MNEAEQRMGDFRLAHKGYIDPNSVYDIELPHESSGVFLLMVKNDYTAGGVWLLESGHGGRAKKVKITPITSSDYFTVSSESEAGLSIASGQADGAVLLYSF